DVVDWEPVQRVEAQVHVPVPVSDLRDLPPEQLQAETLRLTEALATESFDLERAPLLRLRLIRRGDDDHILLLSIHHIVADGWSLEIFNQELSAFYPAFAAGHPISVPDLPLQYTDYARWQRAALTGAVLQRHLAHWRERLAGAPPPPPPPPGHPPPPRPPGPRARRCCSSRRTPRDPRAPRRRGSSTTRRSRGT